MRLQLDTVALLALASFRVASATPVKANDGDAPLLDVDARVDASAKDTSYAKYGTYQYTKYADYGKYSRDAAQDMAPESNEKDADPANDDPAGGYAKYGAYDTKYEHYGKYGDYHSYGRDAAPKTAPVSDDKNSEDKDYGKYGKYGTYHSYKRDVTPKIAPVPGEKEAEYKNYGKYGKYHSYKRDTAPGMAHPSAADDGKYSDYDYYPPPKGGYGSYKNGYRRRAAQTDFNGYDEYGDYGEYGTYETYPTPPGGYGDYPPSSSKRDETLLARRGDGKYVTYAPFGAPHRSDANHDENMDALIHKEEATPVLPPWGYPTRPLSTEQKREDSETYNGVLLKGTVVPSPWGYHKFPEDHEPDVVQKRNDAVPAKGNRNVPTGDSKNYPEYAGHQHYNRDVSSNHEHYNRGITLNDGKPKVQSWEFEKSSVDNRGLSPESAEIVSE